MTDNNKIKAIVFDFGGVLVDWSPHYLYGKYFNNDTGATTAFLKEIGFSEWNLEQDRGRPFALAEAELIQRFPHHAKLIKAYFEDYQESIKGPIQPTVELLKKLKEAGYPLYGLSNWSAETFYRIRNNYAFFSWFDTIVLSGEVKLVKPDPQIYEVLLSKINRTAEECLFIDDSLPNIETANRMGFTGIRFTSGEQLATELQRLRLLP